MNLWGAPPTSGHSTPLRENIPESPTDGFPDYINLPAPDTLPSSGRRVRAGTVPSRFAPGAPMAGLGGLPALLSKTSRPTPTASPYKSPSPGLGDFAESSTSGANNAALLSRLRAGSTPQRMSNYPPSSGPFGPSVFSTNWSSGRERTSTLQSIASIGSQNSNGSPAQSSYSRDGHGDDGLQMRTLDYLGLVDTPQPPRANLASNPFLTNLMNESRQSQSNRFRSYSVNATAKYEEDDDEYTGNMTPYEVQRLQMELETTNAAIQQHNLAVQAFERHASAQRPRAKTMGVLNSPDPKSFMRNYYPTPSRMGDSMTAHDFNQSNEYDGLPEAVQALNLDYASGSGQATDDPNNLEGPSRSLWLGSIPSSTTQTTLIELFKKYGDVENARVLTHKNCGFVNFREMNSAITAKAQMNGKEIFPGAGPVRINFAKPPSATQSPNHDGSFPSPSPDPFAGRASGDKNRNGTPANGAGVISRPASAAALPPIPTIATSAEQIMEIVKALGATEEDIPKITELYNSALKHDRFEEKIEQVGEPTQNRIHDAPKLREIRKRIDNNTWGIEEVEQVAREMLPEIAELSADYLGNTVVQKLFEICGEEVRDQMLAEVAPHLAKIGCHKNGTWAAQKILDTLRLPHQQQLAVDNLRKWAPPLFLDQFGNYVLQACLRYGSPYNDYVYETMLVKLWDLGQERFGSRAMRACLESHHATKEQLRLLAAAIALHCVQLSTNSNGALLLTWFLDTCTFPKRRTVLAPLLMRNLVYLGTHKVAYLTVLKVVNQRNEPEARSILINALFFDESNTLLEDIISDSQCGATFIHKVLTAPFWDSEAQRERVAERIKAVLLKIKASPGQGYQRLMTELKMLGPERNRSQGPRGDHGHPAAERQQQRPQQQMNGMQPQQQYPQYGLPNQGYTQPMQQALQQGMQQQYSIGLPADMQRTDSMDSNMTAYPQYGLQGTFVPVQTPGMVPMSPVGMAQVPYTPMGMQRGPPPQMNYYQQMSTPAPAGFAGGYPQTPIGGDQYGRMGGMMAQQMSPPPTQYGGYGGMNGMSGGYGGYASQMGMQQGLGYGMEQMQGRGQRGRVSRSRRS